MAITISASDVMKLRKQTGAGMMDCKKALMEAEGDFEAATDILRKKGQKIASKRGDNEAGEGLTIAATSEDAKTGIILTLNCETDFVARNSDYENFVRSLVNIALDKLPATKEDLLALPYDGSLSVNDKITEQVGVIGEKLDLSNYAVISSELVAAYNHPGNQLATLVALNINSENAKNAAHQVAMQIAAMAPVAVDKSGVNQATIDHELEIAKELAIQEGKPADMAEKIAQGRLSKFFKESTLLPQAFVKDNKISVAEFLEQSEKGLTVKSFERFTIG